jgi:hypothetical protein
MEGSRICYALSIKGGYYNASGEIIQDLIEAKLFSAPEEAMAFRKRFDPLHKIDEAMLLQVSMFTEVRDDLIDEVL